MARRKRRKQRNKIKIQTPEGWLSGWSDGACAGNPGPMGIGGVLRCGDETVERFSEAAGVGTNNEAEYLAVIRLLEAATKYGAPGVVCRADSELVVRQLNGEYAVRQLHLYRLYKRATRLAQSFSQDVRFVWIPREQNAEADALASKAVGMPQAASSENGGVSPWTGDPDFEPDPKALAGIPDVPQAVARFLKIASPRFRDFLRLKTGGMDAFSRLPIERLRQIIQARHGPKAESWMMAALDGIEDSDYSKNALRWCARGLPPDLALKKASVDVEAKAKFLRR